MLLFSSIDTDCCCFLSLLKQNKQSIIKKSIYDDRCKVCFQLDYLKKKTIGFNNYSTRQANEQLQTLLNIEHIRQHLIKVGLVCIGFFIYSYDTLDLSCYYG